MVSFVSFAFTSALIFKISFLLLTLGLSISSFFSCFRCRVRLFYFFLVSWRMPVLLWTFPLAVLLQCPTGFGLFCFHFHLFLCIFWFLFWFLLWFVGYSEVCCSTSICWNFELFFSCNWDLLNALCSEKMLGMISIFLNLSSLDLWPRMWSILEKVPWALEKKVKFIVLGWNVL